MVVVWTRDTSGRASDKRRLRSTYRVYRSLGSPNVERLTSKQQLGPQSTECVVHGLKLASIVKHAPPKSVESLVRDVDAVVQFRDLKELSMRGRENVYFSLDLGNALQNREPSVPPAVGEEGRQTKHVASAVRRAHITASRMQPTRSSIHGKEAEPDVRKYGRLAPKTNYFFRRQKSELVVRFSRLEIHWTRLLVEGSLMLAT